MQDSCRSRSRVITYGMSLSCGFGWSAHNGWMFSPIESVLFYDRAHGETEIHFFLSSVEEGYRV